MRQITLNVPEHYLELLDKLVNIDKMYPSRAEAIRLSIRDLLIKEGRWT